MKLRVILAALALAVSGVPVAANDDRAAWHPVDAETGRIAEIDGLEALAASFPDSGSVRLRLFNAQLGAEQGEAALASLRWLADRGYVFSEAARGQIPELIGAAFAERAKALLLPPAQPIVTSEIVATVPKEAGLVESVVVPGSDGIFAATSVSERTVWFFTEDGEQLAMEIPGAGNLSGIVSDDKRNVGWVASGNIDGSEDGERFFAGLIGITNDPDQFLRVAAPVGVNLSDLHIADDGTVYASDPLGGGIYRMKAGSSTLETLIAPGTFRSPQGLASSADGGRLYVSDYRYGIALVDLDTGLVTRLASDVPAILDGVDGLWRHGDRLIAVQNGTSPMRISAFRLSDDGLRVVEAEVLERKNPEWTEPLSGSIREDALYYVGNGQWGRFEAGKPVDGKPAVPTQIRRLKL
ncbi:MAG: hypothetical protein R3D99_10655 [Altererythrobacter sp.]